MTFDEKQINLIKDLPIRPPPCSGGISESESEGREIGVEKRSI